MTGHMAVTAVTRRVADDVAQSALALHLSFYAAYHSPGASSNEHRPKLYSSYAAYTVLTSCADASRGSWSAYLIFPSSASSSIHSPVAYA